MKKCFFKLIFAFPLTVFIVFCPCLAKGKDNNQIPPDRLIRVTTGAVEIKGWENQLVKRSPNLARWHWSPQYANTQGYIKSKSPPAAKTIKELDKSGNTRHYLQSYCIPAPAAHHALKATCSNSEQTSAQLLVRQSPHKQMDTHLTLRQTTENFDRSLSGKILDKSKEPVATYGTSYRQDSTQTIRQASSQVHGQLKQSKAKQH